MTIQTKQEGKTLTVVLEGELNTLTAPELQNVLQSKLGEAHDLVVDMTALKYISSAGLRVFLAAGQELEDQGGGITVCGAREEIREIFEATGFDEFIKLV